MRLLDLIAQGRTGLIHTNDGRTLPGAERFKDAVRTCPIRYVLADELARCATQLAFADGDRLTSCLDLVHVPARTLWIEWSDAPRRAELAAIEALEACGAGDAQRAGALITASANGRTGEIRTFWSTQAELAFACPVIVRFDLDEVSAQMSADPVIGSGWATVTAPVEAGLGGFLEHLKFHFDAEWAAYYRDHCATREMRDAVLRDNLATCAFDPPMLFAFLLMLSARSALPQRAMQLDKLNRARLRAGKSPLLEHVEVSAPLYSSSAASPPPGMQAPERRGPRLHHVCGHIVRRGAAVFWRVPHLRGSARLGQVRTRTVELSFPAAVKQHS